MKVSSPDKLMFPADGITKVDLINHYERVGPRMLESMAGRPLTLQRFPGGIDGKGFMQKNAPDYFPTSIRRLAVPKRNGGETLYPVVDEVDDLLYLVNQNTVTFHMWTASADQPNRPDYLVIDLDPEAGDLSGARFATTAIREVLHSFGVDGTPVATGSKGFHIWVPLAGASDFADASMASRAIAGLAVAANPDRLTTEFLKKNRHGRVFVDWLRNGPTATVVVPFSVRPLPGAPVAVPLRWDELADAEPGGWKLGALTDRLDQVAEVEPQALPIDGLAEAARAAGVDLDTPHDRFGRPR